MTAVITPLPPRPSGRFAMQRQALAALRRRQHRRDLPMPTQLQRGLGLLAAAMIILLVGFVLDRASVGLVAGLPADVRRLASDITDAAQSQWTLIPSGVIFVLLMLGDWRTVAPALRRAWMEVAGFAAFIFFSVALSGILANTIKLLAGRFRPSGFFEHGPFAFAPLTVGYLNASFPSGHAQVMGALCLILLTLPFGRVWRWLVPIGCMALASTRILVSAHYPSDVVAGFLIGFVFSWGLAAWFAHVRLVLAWENWPIPVLRLSALRRLMVRSGGGAALWQALLIAYGWRRKSQPKR